jgi:serine/threonine protein kinase
MSFELKKDTRISHYRILKKLGSGGMGEVYLAEDTKLDRNVALKFLPKEFTRDPDARERFKREAKAAAALSHPNIVTIHEISGYENQTYIVMEYVEGETLKDIIIKNSKFKIKNKGEVTSPLQIDLILDITTQICEGLQKAHETGIIHRDIKPQNILMDKDGRVKILDFGLAKLKGVSQLTRESSTLGTTHYLSPEQALGKEVDHRTDIWSLGIILYEMLTGRLPFEGEYEAALIYSILNTAYTPAGELRKEVPSELENIIAKAMHKNSNERYQNIQEMLNDLRNLPDYSKIERKSEEYKGVDLIKTKILFRTGVAIILLAIITASTIIFWPKSNTPPPVTDDPVIKKLSIEQPRLSIAVLSFDDMSPEGDQEYFCDGVSEEIINNLTKIENLKVIARKSSFYYKGKDIDISKIGRDLGVSTILEGSVRKSGNQLRITAQLINVSDRSHLWSDSFDKELKDIFKVQDEIAQAVVKALEITLFDKVEVPSSKRYTTNVEAQEVYLKGCYALNKGTEKEIKKGISYFKQAIERDPGFALAYSKLARCYTQASYYSYIRPKDAFPKAKSAINAALKLDEAIGEAHLSLGMINFIFEWDWYKSEDNFKRALKFTPSSADAHYWYGEYLTINSRIDEGIEEYKRAKELDPRTPMMRNGLAFAYGNAERFDDAITVLKGALNIDPKNLWSHARLARQYAYKKSFEEAIAIADTTMDLMHPTYDQAVLEFIGWVYAISQQRKKAFNVLNQLNNISKTRYVDPFSFSVIYAGLKDADQVIRWLEKAHAERSPAMVIIKIYKPFDMLRLDPRFTALINKMGLDK